MFMEIKKNTIIIYRKSREDALMAFEQFIYQCKLLNLETINRIPRIIFNEYDIQFWCGDYWRMGGLRPKYYNTDSRLASEYLEQSAYKCGGKEIVNIDDLYKILCENNS